MPVPAHTLLYWEDRRRFAVAVEGAIENLPNPRLKPISFTKPHRETAERLLRAASRAGMTVKRVQFSLAHTVDAGPVATDNPLITDVFGPTVVETVINDEAAWARAIGDWGDPVSPDFDRTS